MAAANSNTVSATNIFQVLPTKNFPFSYAELSKTEMRGPMQGLCLPEAIRDVVWMTDDFNGKSINSTYYWAVANGGGAGATSFATNVQANGIIRGTTGTANGVTASVSLIAPIIYQASTNMGMEIRYKVVTANTSIRFEAGFIDAVPASNTASFNSMDGSGTVPTMFSANSVTVGIDTSATNNLLNLVTIGSATNQAAKRTNGTVGLSAAGTYQTIRIQTYSRDGSTNNAADASFWVDGVFQGSSPPDATAGVGCVNAQVLLAPWVYFEAINSSSKSLDIDYITVWSQRIT